VALAVVASTSDAVAKPAFLSWQTWDPYDRPTEPVSVAYVWSGNYDGIQFPETPTTVMRVKVPGPKRSLYWRATTLDDYTGLIWDEELELGEASVREQIDASGPLLPEAAGNEGEWVRQEITIEALRDTRLPASAQPVRWEPQTEAPVADENGEVVVVPDGIRRDQRYTVWSYAPRPNPSELNAFRGDYPEAVAPYLEVVYEPVPEWSTEGRDTLMDVFFGASGQFEVAVLESVYQAAVGITSGAQSPYEAAALLETWFREAGGFVYDEQPPAPIGGTPALVDFVNETKRGYCQHYAGAMALMLRLLGVPSRVAVGFTSGTYKNDSNEWVVQDTNAHAWVEVWFPDVGWIPFDPTPGRGELDATYAVTSQTYNAGDAAGIGFADRLERLSPTRAEAIRSAAQTPGLTNPGFGAGSSGTFTVVRDQGRGLLTVLAMIVGGAIAALLVLKAARRGLRFAARDPRALAGACRRDVAGYLADQGVDLPPSATMPEIGTLLQRFYAIDATSFVRNVTVARFGPPADAGEALRRARRELREIRRGLRNRLGVVSRVRGALSIRSLSL
jgi:transglutaminase-like putative cysteine protease